MDFLCQAMDRTESQRIAAQDEVIAYERVLGYIHHEVKNVR